ncbi:VOC family protein [Jeongeupia sp. USM3]|uniref:VOC family protein n=1 Tax=Jeongeupia sp. USM3 TaxID=1906741 RepID=UPI00089DD9D5|nr:VOC family protein [Jeongeupia sp. USM3]AOY00024.1 hypothetical protein BJP62_05905 [Jeongeupia sp. USM3]
MKLLTYVFLNGKCEEALDFYTKAVGAKALCVSRFSDAPANPGMTVPSGWKDKIMHSLLQVGETQLMLSDCDLSAKAHQGFQLTLCVESRDEGERLFNALADGGAIEMPFGPTFWALGFGTLVDRFGIRWSISAGEQPA